MRECDIEILYSFIKRPGMYVGERTLLKIEIFLYAYELGSKDECVFTTMLGTELSNQFDVKSTERLTVQLETAAKESNSSWFELLRKVGTVIIVQASDSENKFVYLRKLKDRLESLLVRSSSTVNFTLISEWIGLNRDAKEWEGANLSKEILLKIDAISNCCFLETKHEYELSENSELVEQLSKLKMMVEKENKR